MLKDSKGGDIMKKKRGRPMSSRDVKVVPEFKENPDIEKLGRVLIAIAMNLAKKKLTEEQASASNRGDVETMT